jgi:hypothetical protein
MKPEPEEWVYNRPKHGWVCFHCGDVFRTPGEARDHFGFSPAATPACRIKLGGERSLVMALRQTENQRDELQVRLDAVRLGLDKELEDESVERFHATRQWYVQSPRHLDRPLPSSHREDE